MGMNIWTLQLHEKTTENLKEKKNKKSWTWVCMLDTHMDPKSKQYMDLLQIAIETVGVKINACSPMCHYASFKCR